MTARKLEKNLHDRMDHMMITSQTALTSEEDIADVSILRKAWATTRQRVETCSHEGHHLKDNISTLEIYSTSYVVQLVASTDENIIHGKNRGL